MCIETMASKPKHSKTYFLRKTLKPGSKLVLKLLRVSPEDNEALRRCGVSAVSATIRRYLRREQRRARLTKLAGALGDIGEKDQRETTVCEESPAAACINRQPSGAMAPENTTQYLMGNVYADMKANIHTAPAAHETSTHLYSECLSPWGVYAAMDSHESCLAFQQRDFEEVFNQCWELE
ncbi:uncharacterized protein LOC144461771 [Epinephelus lanceolatus]